MSGVYLVKSDLSQMPQPQLLKKRALSIVKVNCALTCAFVLTLISSTLKFVKWKFVQAAILTC